MNICLCRMTADKMRSFFLDFAYDPDTFDTPDACLTYKYDQAQADVFYKKHNRADRAHFAVMLGNEVIGDLYLKHIDMQAKSCTLSIHMKNDSVKNQGYGTAAETLALQYAFEQLGLNTVFADVLSRNLRSRHVLEKVGFVLTGVDERLCYYRCDKDAWTPLDVPKMPVGGSV